jgi:hypothetical protein
VRKPQSSAFSASSRPRPSTDDPRRATRERALQVLRDWDARRAAAFARADVVALGRLYVRGSGLARQDLAVLRDYARRDVRVTELVPQVASARVLTASEDVVELAVVERVGVTRVAVGAQERVLAPSRFARHVLRFERVRGSWRLSSVRVA